MARLNAKTIDSDAIPVVDIAALRDGTDPKKRCESPARR